MSSAETVSGRITPATVALMGALRLKPDDLQANREGRLSDAQRQRYESPGVSTTVQLVLIGHLALIVGVLGLLAIAVNQPIMWILLLVVAGLSTVPFAAVSSGGSAVLKQDIARGEVESVCGMAVLEADTDRRTPLYRVSIGDVTLVISAKIHAAFRNGGDYCLYYLPRSSTLLSAEALF